MNRSPYPFADFVRAKDNLANALIELDEPYAMLTGETGTGKTALLSELRGQLDRTRHRLLYFAESRKLGAAGLVKVIGENLRVRTSMVHSVSLDRLLSALSEESRTILLWLDEAQDLPAETLAEVRALAESDLDGARRVQVLFVGLPKLRAELRSHPYLWRRVVVREEITGLAFGEAQDFLDHHFTDSQSKRLCELGLTTLFERAGGAPGLLMPMYRAVLARAGSAKGKIEPEQVQDTLDRWDLA
ncbi:MAG: ATP-binding protein [Nannocystaceae bacterium]